MTTKGQASSCERSMCRARSILLTCDDVARCVDGRSLVRMVKPGGSHAITSLIHGVIRDVAVATSDRSWTKRHLTHDEVTVAAYESCVVGAGKVRHSYRNDVRFGCDKVPVRPRHIGGFCW